MGDPEFMNAPLKSPCALLLLATICNATEMAPALSPQLEETKSEVVKEAT
jgi:hypothetical protein